MTPTNSEIKEWRNNPATKYMLAKLSKVQSELLQSALINESIRDNICDRCLGIQEAVTFMQTYEED